jgi:DNA ligase-1
MDNILVCIEDTVKSKKVSMENYIDYTTEKSLERINLPLGTDGTVVYPYQNAPVRKSGEDIYVPAMKDKFMLADTVFKPDETKISSRVSDYHYLTDLSIKQPPIGWYMSEKFDGQRAIWDGSKFVTRGSSSGEPRVYPYVPIWFIALMPPGIALDGEFFIARGKFSQTTSILKTKLKDESERKKKDNSKMDLGKRWLEVKYQVFDTPTNEPFEKRLKDLELIVQERCKVWNLIELPPYLKKGKCPLVLTKQYLIKSMDQLYTYYDELVSNEAEGVMIRAPKIPYLPKRTKLMLKLKPEEESECIIVGYVPGKGQFENMLGSFSCKLITNGVLIDKFFNVGGMKRSIRMNYNKKNSEEYHPEGTIITFKYTEMTPDGIPRFPRYKGIRYDFNLN